MEIFWILTPDYEGMNTQINSVRKTLTTSRSNFFPALFLESYQGSGLLYLDQITSIIKCTCTGIISSAREKIWQVDKTNLMLWQYDYTVLFQIGEIPDGDKSLLRSKVPAVKWIPVGV